jgi:hypothetical protein
MPDRCEWLLPPGIQEETEWYDPTQTFAEKVAIILADAGMRPAPSQEETNR